MTKRPWARPWDTHVFVVHLHWDPHPSPGPYVLGILLGYGCVPFYIG